MKKNILFRSQTSLPLTSYLLFLFIARDPMKAYDQVGRALFGAETKRFAACAVRGDAGFGLFLPSHETDHDTVAHEIRHAVDYLLDTIGHDVGIKDEFGPRLAGFMAGYVYKNFKKAGLKILD